MKLFFKIASLTVLIIAIQACKTSKDFVIADEFIEMDTITIEADPEIAIYQASEKRISDVLHTKLEVSFDWDSTYLYGKANLIITPYFYPTKTLTLDAKGFQIHKVALVDNIGKQTPLKYTYNKAFLVIELGKTYTRKDTYNIFIDYTAMPNKLEAGGSSAITEDKGLYFINPDGKDPNKPKQIWTQGETEASSCWFPTIDSPNEKTTQEIYMTVDSIYVTLSNGELMFQTENGDGTRTDYWKQDKPHAPYLFMMAVGDFAIAKDEWRNKPVHYYVEKKYEEFAKQMYPNTTEMLTFFSDKLGVEYPWEKYHQIIVRDYVSGAMENTGAVIFGDFIQGDDRFLIDNSGEDIVAHEMFHHWFGDLVTCESWSNLPLNESFATYGEYLWNEYKYGKDQADLHGDGDLNVYLGQARSSKKNLIRFDYESEMEMFDSHSYQKGGRVLHQLRNIIGDDAFFTGLELYLRTNQYKTVEIHQLRLAFEEITGEDLNWYFNQWFLAAGHPIINIKKSFSNDTLTVEVEQTQEGENIANAFIIPTKIGVIKANGKPMIHSVRINQRKQIIKIPLTAAPKLVNFDWDKTILGVVNQDIDKNEAITLYNNCNHYLDKKEAIKLLKNKKDSTSLDVIEKALSDAFWYIRKEGIDNVKKLAKERPTATMNKLKVMSKTDTKSSVRSAANSALAKYFKEGVQASFYNSGLKDPSYLVVSSSLQAIYSTNAKEGAAKAEQLENEDNTSIKLTIANIYAEEGAAKRVGFYENALETITGFNKYPLLISYGEFLQKQDNSTIENALPALKEESTREGFWFVRMAAINAMVSLKKDKTTSASDMTEKMETTTDEAEKKKISSKIEEAKSLIDKINLNLKEINETESNKNLKRILEGELK